MSESKNKFSSFGFNYLEESESITEEVQKAVFSISNRRKNRKTNFKSMLDTRKDMIHLPELPLQFLIGNYGLPEKCLMEVIGGAGVGKSTLVHWIEGQFLAQGCPVYHQECEGKPIRTDHIRRIVSPDPVLGQKIVKAMHFDSARSLSESFEKFVDWIKIMRGKMPGSKVSIPINVPLLVVIDPWGKLMSKEEAAGFYDYGNAATAKGGKDLLDITNMGHAKAAHRWVRRLPSLLDSMNVCLILVQHQNEEVDMSGTPSFIPASAMATQNITKIGGLAFNQLDALQMVIAKKGMLKNSSQEVIGSTMKVRVVKNSYGSEHRQVEYDLVNNKYKDSEKDGMDRVLRFDRWFADWCAENSFMGTTVSKKRYTCKDLGAENVKSDVFYQKFQDNDAAVDAFGRLHNIHGYSSVADELINKAMLNDTGKVEKAEDKPLEPEPEPEVKPKRKRGRPSKKDLEERARLQAEKDLETQ